MKKKSMNKAVKSLSIMLALSMGFSFVPGFNAVEIEAAAKSGVVLHGKTKVFSAKKGTSAYIGEKKLDLDLLFRGKNISKKVKWVSNDTSVVTVNKKNGKLTAKGNGSAVITAKYKNKKYKALVKVFTRAESMTVEDNGTAVTEVNLTEGTSKTLKINYKLADKVVKAGGVSSTYNSYLSPDGSDAISVNKEKASSTEFTITANKAGESYIDIIGSQRSAVKAALDSKKVTARIKVVVASKPAEFTGKQTGAKKITVTGQNLTNNVKDYVVKVGASRRDITGVTLNSSATEAVLELTADINNLDYTVEFGGKTVTFKGEMAKASKIDVPNKYLVLNGDNSSAGGKIEYRVTNQFGEDITKTVSGLNVNISVGKGMVNPAKGCIDVTGMSANLPLKTNVSMNINKTDSVNFLTETFNLTLEAKSKASAVTVKGVYSNNTKKPYSLAVNNAAENAAARLLVEVKDQYGRRMNSTEGVNIVAMAGLTGLGIDQTKVYSDLIEVDGVDYVAIPFTGTNAVKSGSVTIRLLAIYGQNGSNTAETTINISGVKQVSKFSVIPPSEVYAGEVAYFNYTATNDAGQSVTDYATLSDTSYGVRLPEAFSWENTANGTARLKYDSKKDNIVKNITWGSGITQMQSTGLFTVAANLQPVQVSFVVYMPASPTTIRNLTLDGVLPGGITENVLPKVKVADDKGRELTDLSGMSVYYLGVKKKSGGTIFTTVAAGASVGTADTGVQLFKLSDLKSASLKFKASAAAVTGYETEEFTFAIYKDVTGTNKVAGSEINVRMTVAELKNLTSFNIVLPDALYSSDSNTGYDNITPVVTGKASDGTAVQLGSENFTLRDVEGVVEGNRIVPSKVKEKAKRGDFTDKITAIVNDGKGTEVSKTVTISAKAPAVTKVEARSAELSLANFTFNGIRDALVISDQYTSEANGVSPSSEADKNSLYGVRLVSSSSNKIKADWNNTPRVVFSGAAAGDMVNIEVLFESGVKGTFSFTLK